MVTAVKVKLGEVIVGSVCKDTYGEIREMTPFCKILNYLPKNSKIWIKIDPRGEDEDPSKITRLASNECDDTNKGPR